MIKNDETWLKKNVEKDQEWFLLNNDKKHKLFLQFSEWLRCSAMYVSDLD